MKPLPCPFCGCDLELKPLYDESCVYKYVHPESFCILSDQKFEFVNTTENVEKWNKRVPLVVMTKKEHTALHNRLNPRKNKNGRFVKVNEIIKVKRTSETAKLPEKKSIGAAGYDMYADIQEPVEIKPGESVLLSSGLAFEFPVGYFGAIYARSGMAVKQGLRPSTCVSIIDQDFRGEVKLPIYNDSNETRVIYPHDRIAQIIFREYVRVELEVVDELSETERGMGGFGSTGVK